MPEIDERGADYRPRGNLPEVDFALVLARLIELAKNDPVQLRSSIYELARQKLGDQLLREEGRERLRLMQALESAIEAVETFSERQDALQPDNRQIAGIPSNPGGRGAVAVLDDSDTPQHPLPAKVPPAWLGRPAAGRNPARMASPQAALVDIRTSPFVRARTGPRSSVFLARALMMIGITAAVLSAGIYLQRHPVLVAAVRNMIGADSAATPEPSAAVKTPASVPDAQRQTPSATPAKEALLPKTFGIYAVDDERLFELEPLPGRVPDQRVAMSAAISTPSRTVLPDGKLRFIVYRRDSVGSVPDRAEVRVIATVKSAMTFAPSGKPSIMPTQDSWVIRNISFSYRVAPVKENPDMYEIRHESDEFALAPGRYALVIRGTAYDFTVPGAVSDPNQCLERVEAANGSFYSPCQKP